MPGLNSVSQVITRRLMLATLGDRGILQPDAYNAGQPLKLCRIDVGKIILPTGRICVADAYSATECPPLNVLVPAGVYPVEVVLAQFSKRLGSDRGAFLIVRFSEVKIARWRPVTAVASADPCFTDAAPNLFVQEGITGVFSPESADIHFARVRQSPQRYPHRLNRRTEESGCCAWLNFRPGRSKENVILCNGGFGDGSYLCFGGYERSGRLAQLVLDFQVADAA